MPVKRKPKPPRLRERVAKSVRSHPRGIVVTLSGVGAVIAIFAAVWPFFPRFLTVEAADTVIKELRREAAEHEKKDAQDRLENMYGQQRIETLILRNRVNECAAKTRSIKPVETTICTEYQQEYREAERRTRYLYEKVKEGAK